MLGKRSRPNKFHLMSSENGECSAPNKFFNNPRLFIGFNSKIAGFPEGEGGGSRSPTSTLDAKAFSDYKACRSPRGFDNPDSHGVGLGILAALQNDNSNNKTALLSPKSSPTRIPVNKKRSQAISIGPTRPHHSGMEYSESYTCITSHGPNPIIRQIFNHPVEAEKRNPNYCKPAVFETAASSFCDADDDAPTFAAADFLSVCYLCRRQLRHGKDIYMYRGDKAFCSVECRYEQIASDEKERCSMKRVMGTSPQPQSCFFPGSGCGSGTNIFTTRTMAAA